MPGKVGGARPGAGRKPGSPNKVDYTKRQTIAQLAAQYTNEALATLAEIMRTGSSDAARVNAANSLLDRGHGKAGVAEGQGDDDEPASLTVTIKAAAPVAEVRVSRTDG